MKGLHEMITDKIFGDDAPLFHDAVSQCLRVEPITPEQSQAIERCNGKMRDALKPLSFAKYSEIMDYFAARYGKEPMSKQHKRIEFETFAHLPELAFTEAARAVMRTQTYKYLPLPAHFLEHAEEARKEIERTRRALAELTRRKNSLQHGENVSS